MKLIKKSLDKLYKKQWTIGIAKTDGFDIIKDDINKLNFFWFPLRTTSQFYADPFIHKHKNGNYYIFFENFSYKTNYGKISLMIVDNEFKVLQQLDVLDTKSHLSYPFLFHQNNKLFILPESSKVGDQYSYEFNFETNSLTNKKLIISNEKLLDPTIIAYKNKFWLFATQRGKDSNAALHIHCADNWDKEFVPHKNNPLKHSDYGSRPAGNFFFQNDEIYRPAQNCRDFYGKSIIINKIDVLSTNDFKETPVKEIVAPLKCKFNFGIHTINISNDVIVIDGLRRIFNPFDQLTTFITRKLFKK